MVVTGVKGNALLLPVVVVEEDLNWVSVLVMRGACCPRRFHRVWRVPGFDPRGARSRGPRDHGLSHPGTRTRGFYLARRAGAQITLHVLTNLKTNDEGDHDVRYTDRRSHSARHRRQPGLRPRDGPGAARTRRYQGLRDLALTPAADRRAHRPARARRHRRRLRGGVPGLVVDDRRVVRRRRNSKSIAGVCSLTVPRSSWGCDSEPARIAQPRSIAPVTLRASRCVLSEKSRFVPV
jgi:hypothetical protein